MRRHLIKKYAINGRMISRSDVSDFMRTYPIVAFHSEDDTLTPVALLQGAPRGFLRT